MQKWPLHLSGQFKELSLTEAWKIQVTSTAEIRTHDLCDAGAMLNQLSFEATQLGGGQFFGLI